MVYFYKLSHLWTIPWFPNQPLGKNRPSDHQGPARMVLCLSGKPSVDVRQMLQPFPVVLTYICCVTLDELFSLSWYLVIYQGDKELVVYSKHTFW